MAGDINLDFDKADFGQPAGALKCATCPTEIRDRYFEVNGTTVCTTCRGAIAALERPEGGLKRFALATLMGMAGGAVGALVWYAVARLFNLEVGLIAILVGWLVGTGVHKGSQGRGGRKYQVLAAFVTYASIVTTYIPAIYEGLQKGAAGETAAAGTTNTEGATTAGTPEPAPAQPSAPASGASVASPAVPPPSLGTAVGALFLASAILYAIAFAAPFLMGFENIIGILIIGFAVYQAWTMNTRRVLDIKGPFRVAPRAEATPKESAPDETTSA
jgi:hypothetical protein